MMRKHRSLTLDRPSFSGRYYALRTSALFIILDSECDGNEKDEDLRIPHKNGIDIQKNHLVWLPLLVSGIRDLDHLSFDKTLVLRSDNNALLGGTIMAAREGDTRRDGRTGSAF